MLSSPSSVLVVCTLQHGWPLKVFIPFFSLFAPLPSAYFLLPYCRLKLYESLSEEHAVLYNLVLI